MPKLRLPSIPAAGIRAGATEKELINERISRWKFSYPTERDRVEHAAVQAAAQFLRERANYFPNGVVPSNPAQLAILAIKVYDVFVDHASASTDGTRTGVEIANAIMEKLKQFEAA